MYPTVKHEPYMNPVKKKRVPFDDVQETFIFTTTTGGGGPPPVTEELSQCQIQQGFKCDLLAFVEHVLF